MRHLPAALLLAALFSTLAACQLPDDPAADGNPLDPTSPSYEAPIVEIVEGPGEGVTVDSENVPVTWIGNQGVDEYRYTVDAGEPSEWSGSKSATLRLLDEGPHAFEVEGRRSQTNDSTPAARRTFTVDAVKGPALMFKPRRVIAAAGDTVQIEVVAEEVADVMLVRAVVQFDDARIDVLDIEPGDFLGETGGRPLFLEGAEFQGVRDLNIAVAEGDAQGLTGTGTIAVLSLKLKANQETELEFLSSSKFRDPDGTDVDIRQRVPAVIEVR